MPKVSVIMPVYNCEKFLEHSIRSVQNQTFGDWELIVVNDASTDKSLDKIFEFAYEDKRIKVIDMTFNQGVGKCRNIGISYAKGRYLAFLDSDDLWSKQKLAKQLAFMEEKDAGLSHTGYAFINEQGFILPTGQVCVDECVDRKKYMKTTQIGMSTVMVDRTKIPNLKFPEDRKLCEDATAWMGLLRKGERFYGLNDVLLLYRVRSNQLSQNKIKMAKNTLKRYLNEPNLPLYQKLYYFSQYAYHGFQKRLVKNKLDVTNILSNFNCREG